MADSVSTSRNGPLEGIHVLDLTSYIAGPYAAMMLSDMGANVVKAESPAGDSFRELPGFFGWNRGKRSVAVDLKHPDAREIIHRLVSRSDVALENMRPGTAERLGVDYETMKRINPRLVYCSITAFGSDGPYKDRPGFDPLLQAMGGIMTLQGFGGPPEYVRIALVDYYAAALACQGILAALYLRERCGRGQKVETSLLHAALALQSGNVVQYPAKGHVYRDNPTYRLYRASDGEWFFLACGNQSFWAKLCRALGRPDLAADSRFGSWLSRLDNREVLIPILESVFAGKTVGEWLSLLGAHDIPCAKAQALEEFLKDPAVLHHGLTAQYQHPVEGPMTLMGLPLRFSESGGRPGVAPPVLGEHTTVVLQELGFTEDQIAGLHERRVVSGPASP